MQFQVPQFIEVEDKIFGPLTFKQFIYCGGALGAAYIIYRILPIYIAGPFMAIVLGFGAALAFFQFNGRPFILGIESAFFFFVHAKLYLWNNEKKAKKQVPVIGAPNRTGAQVYVPKLSESRLHELAWSLDIKERVASGLASNSQSNVFKTGQEPPALIRTSRQALGPASMMDTA